MTAVMFERVLDARYEISTRKLEDGTYQVRITSPRTSDALSETVTMAESHDFDLALIHAAEQAGFIL